MENSEDYKIIYEDSELEITTNSIYEGEYILNLKEKRKGFYLPRGTLGEIAKSDREHGRRMLEALTTSTRYLLEGTDLTADSLIAAICKAYIREEESWQEFTKGMR